MDATADINELDAVPFVGEAGMDVYRRFLASKQRPRAFAISEKGATSFRAARTLSPGPRPVAKNAAILFHLRVQRQVMFRQFVRTAASSLAGQCGVRPAPARTWIATCRRPCCPQSRESGKDGYEKFLATTRAAARLCTQLARRWAWNTGPDAAQRAKAACERRGSACFIYAIDTRVVWDGVRQT